MRIFPQARAGTCGPSPRKFALAKSAFGTWKSASAPAADAATAAKAAETQPRVIVVDMPDAGQAAVIVGRRGIRRTDPAYMQAIVANSVLGAGYSSRLNQEIRIKRGLSYGAGSSFEPRLMLPLSLSYDHRAVDGADGARFITKICSLLANPLALLVEG